jgi:hypothetical protein
MDASATRDRDMERLWVSDGIELPDAIEHALASDTLVVFCGAGVSAADPSLLPGFRGLVEGIAADLGRTDLLPEDPKAPVQFDVIMGELDELRHDVHARVTDRLKNTTTPNSYHRDLLQLFSRQGQTQRIVTTNFDLLFEAAAAELGMTLTTHTAPALPLGDDFEGLVHLHGRVAPSPQERMVVTDSDFGSAYIVEGWATQFLSRMFARYTVLFIGYSADDTVLRYLARALPRDGDTRFAFMAEDDASTMTVKWERLGVRTIPFPSPENDRYSALKSFVGHLRERTTATASERFDRVHAVVTQGPEALHHSAREFLWMMGDPEHARHFMTAADSVIWLSALDKAGALDDVFTVTTLQDPDGWARWAARSLESDKGDALLAAVFRHKGALSPGLWFQIWGHLAQSYEPVIQHQQLLLLLTAEQPARDFGRLSALLRVIADKDVAAAEVLLHHLLIPRLVFRPNAWRVERDLLESDLVLDWKDSSIREAWPTMLPSLSDPDHLLSIVLDLIRSAEATDALFTGNDRRFALSARRRRVDGVDQFHQDDPYVLVIDIARDLLREFVRNEGPQRAIRYLAAPSEMIRRLAIDALAEAKSTEADSLLDRIVDDGLVFSIATKPEVFKLMRAVYAQAELETRLRLLAAVETANGEPNRSPVRDYDRYNVLVWLKDGVTDNDPVHTSLDAMKRRHEDFSPRMSPDVDLSFAIGTMDTDDRTAEGRYRGMSVTDVVRDLGLDPNVDDDRDNGPMLRELADFLEQTPGVEVGLLAEMSEQTLWSTTIWSAVLDSAVRRGASWTAGELLEEIAKLPSGIDTIAQGLVYAIAYPGKAPDEFLENGRERSRLLLGLWRRASVEASDGFPTDPNRAQSTARGALAYYYVQTTIRVAQELGQTAIGQEGVEGFSELLRAQAANHSDPSPMMLARYASHIQSLATGWFDSNLRPELETVVESSPNVSLWAGIVSGDYFSRPLMETIRGAVRVGWPQLSRSLPGSVERFVDLHAAQFTDSTAPEDHAWVDAFIASAPVATRVRWIHSVARRLDGQDPDFQRLLFAHWQHRIDGQPPVVAAEERALLDWVILPGIDTERATDLFVAGPPAAADSNGFDYYDLDDLQARDNTSFLRVASHLLDGRSSLPSFLSLLVESASDAGGSHGQLTKEIWEKLLGLGFAPARNYLQDE